MKGKYIAAGLSGASIIIKKISIPKVRGKGAYEQIKWEAEQYLPFSPSQVHLTFEPLKTSSSPDTMDILLVAAQKNIVRLFVERLQRAGGHCAIMDANSFAIANCFNCNHGDLRILHPVLIHIGASNTSLIILQDGDVIFARDLSIGGRMYTNELHKQLGISVQEAEALKVSVSQQQENPDEVLKTLNEVTDIFISEVRNSLDFFSSINPGIKLEQGFCCGGGALLPGLVQKISKGTGLSLNSLNPFSSIKVKSGILSEEDAVNLAPFMSNVVGLALRQMGDH